MAHPHHCLVTLKLRSTYFNVLYTYFIIKLNVGPTVALCQLQKLMFILILWQDDGNRYGVVYLNYKDLRTLLRLLPCCKRL